MLNHLIQHQRCIITTISDEAVIGVYGGIETQHGDWSVLIHQGMHTISIPVERIHTASVAA